MRAVSTQGVGWASVEASDPVAPPLNLVLYMYLRIFAYISNVLIVSFEYMELILASGTPKNFKFLRKSCLSTDLAPVMKLTWSTFQLCRWITVQMDHTTDHTFVTVVTTSDEDPLGVVKIIWRKSFV